MELIKNLMLCCMVKEGPNDAEAKAQSVCSEDSNDSNKTENIGMKIVNRRKAKDNSQSLNNALKENEKAINDSITPNSLNPPLNKCYNSSCTSNSNLSFVTFSNTKVKEPHRPSTIIDTEIICGNEIVLNGEIFWNKDVVVDRLGIKMEKRRKKSGVSVFGVGSVEKENGKGKIDFVLNYLSNEAKNIPLFLVGYDKENEYYYFTLAKENTYKEKFIIIHLIDYNYILEVDKLKTFQIGKIFFTINILQNGKSIIIKVKNKEKKEEKNYNFTKSDLPITIGRSHCKINIKNNSVSKSHCSLEFSLETMMFYLTDNGSTNGTFLVLDEQTKIIIASEMHFKLNESKFSISFLE